MAGDDERVVTCLGADLRLEHFTSHRCNVWPTSYSKAEIDAMVQTWAEVVAMKLKNKHEGK